MCRCPLGDEGTRSDWRATLQQRTRHQAGFFRERTPGVAQDVGHASRVAGAIRERLVSLTETFSPYRDL